MITITPTQGPIRGSQKKGAGGQQDAQHGEDSVPDTGEYPPSHQSPNNQLKEREIERRRKQLDDSTDVIRKLQEELEDAKRTASGVKWELRENELKSMSESEVTRCRAQITTLEAKL